MFFIVARLSVRARAMTRRSPCTSVMPALSMATSVPVPIAMPTVASASAGASLMPSPAIATILPRLCRSRITARFSAGNTSARTSSSPSERPTASAVVRLSPVSITMLMSCDLRERSASAVVALMRSATPSSPAGMPSIATNTTV
jgi:hypothetical protein